MTHHAETAIAEPDAAKALDALFAPLNRSDAPGLVVGVARRGEVVYRRGFGLASLEHAVANTPRTRMRIGSTTKHFTCLAALLLVEDGKFDLDAPANVLLPELPTLRGVPTWRQLMSHTGGYRCEIDLGMIGGGAGIQHRGQGLAAQVRQSDVNFAPGEGQIYCNGGYHLLSIAIERASGVPFAQFLADRIFAPLGMTETALILSDMQITPGIATFHIPIPSGGWRRGVFVTEEILGEGGMASTVDDMLAWLAHFHGPKRVGSEASWQELLTPARLNNGFKTPYALGLMRHLYRGVEVIHHAGGVAGATCQMLTVPSQGLDIVMMTNGVAVSPVAMGYKIVDALLGEAALQPIAATADVEGFRHLIGSRYHGETTGAVFGFEEAAGKLAVTLFNSPPLPVLRDEGDIFRIGFEDFAIGELVWEKADLAPADGGPPAVLAFSEAGRKERFRRLPSPPPPTTAVGKALVGPYRCPDLDADAKVALAGDALMLSIRSAHGTGVFKLAALSDAVFAGAPPEMPMFGCVVTTSSDRGGLKGFHLSTGRTRGLWFGRVL